MSKVHNYANSAAQLYLVDLAGSEKVSWLVLQLSKIVLFIYVVRLTLFLRLSVILPSLQAIVWLLLASLDDSLGMFAGQKNQRLRTAPCWSPKN